MNLWFKSLSLRKLDKNIYLRMLLKCTFHTYNIIILISATSLFRSTIQVNFALFLWKLLIVQVLIILIRVLPCLQCSAACPEAESEAEEATTTAN